MIKAITLLLETLRQFRQTIPSTTSPIVNAEQSQKNQAAINLLDSWLSEDEDASEHLIMLYVHQV